MRCWVDSSLFVGYVAGIPITLIFHIVGPCLLKTYFLPYTVLSPFLYLLQHDITKWQRPDVREVTIGKYCCNAFNYFSETSTTKPNVSDWDCRYKCAIVLAVHLIFYQMIKSKWNSTGRWFIYVEGCIIHSKRNPKPCSRSNHLLTLLRLYHFKIMCFIVFPSQHLIFILSPNRRRFM